MSGRFVCDASAFIAAWNIHYHMQIFPSLWEEIGRNKSEIILIKPIYDEIDPVSASDKNKSVAELQDKYPLRMWMNKSHFVETEMDSASKQISLQLESKYEVDSSATGASQKDVALIAFAYEHQKVVVTYEEMQDPAPVKKSRYRIPLICKSEEVECIKFADMLKLLNIKI